MLPFVSAQTIRFWIWKTCLLCKFQISILYILLLYFYVSSGCKIHGACVISDTCMRMQMQGFLSLQFIYNMSNACCAMKLGDTVFIVEAKHDNIFHFQFVVTLPL